MISRCLIDISTQEKSFWLNDNIVAALIGVFSSFVVLIITILIERNRKRKEEQELRKKRLGYFSVLLNGIENYSKQQADNLSIIIDELAHNPLNIPLLKFSPKSDIERFVSNLDLEEYFYAFVTHYGNDNKVIKNYKNIVSSVDYFNLQFDQLFDMIKNARLNDYNRKIELKNLFENSTEMAAKNTVDALLVKRDDYINFLYEHLQKYLQTRSAPDDLKSIYENYIIPVKLGIAKHFTDIPQAIEIANLLQKSTYVYNDIVSHQIDLKNDFESIQRILNEVIASFQNDCKQIKADFLN